MDISEWILALLAGLVLVSLVINIALRLRIKAKTAELSSKNEKLQQEMAERKRAEETLMEAQTLSSLSRTTASIAHEMRTPLTAADMDLEDVAEILPDGEAKDLILNAQSLIQEVLLIIRTMLKVYRSEGQDASEVDINQELRDAVLLFGRKAKGVEIIYDFTANAHTWVSGNLSRIFINLIDNALDAVQNRGRLTLITRPVEENFMVVVEDNGPGIPPEILEKVFDSGFTTKKTGQGTGLGLWIVKQECECIGGQIKVESEVGKFARFTVMIPRRRSQGES